MQKILFSVGVSLMALAGMARDFYVDANYGNDAWDGTSATIPTDATSTVGPKKTLQSMFTDATVHTVPASGDVVHAAPGMYNEGSMTAMCSALTCAYRVNVPAGVKLISTEGAEKTFIIGEADNSEKHGCGPDAVRCVRLNSSSKLCGFTLTAGHVNSWESGENYFGGAVKGTSRDSSYVVDCIITNNVSGRGAAADVGAIRCIFDKNTFNTSTPDAIRCVAYGSIFKSDIGSGFSCYQGGPLVNCTYYGSGSGKAIYSASGLYVTVRNCLIVGDIGTYVKLYRTYYTGSLSSSYTSSEDGSQNIALADLKLSDINRPKAGSPAINAGNNGYYTLPITVEKANKDIAGYTRVQGGTIDIGAYEVGAEAGNWYVDAAKGDDTNDCHTASTACKTLAEALTRVKAARSLGDADVVYVAPGVYSEGVMKEVCTAAVTNNYRAIVPSGVKLVATGSATNTVILGAADVTATTTKGCGVDAVRCLRMYSDTTLRGFTLTGGHTRGLDINTGADWGGAVNAGQTYGNPSYYGGAYIIDCIITNNYAGRAAVWGGKSLRCKFNDNYAASTAGDIIYGSSYNCLFGNLQNTGTYNVYTEGVHINGTFYGTGVSTHNSSKLLKNCLVLKPAQNSAVVYNCCVLQASGNSSQYNGDSESTYFTSAKIRVDAQGKPTRNSPALNKGKDSYYYDYFPSALAAEKDKDIDGNVRVRNGQIDAGAYEIDSTPVGLYVNADTGDDDNNDGSSPEKAFKTLSKAVAVPTLIAGDCIYAAAGTYDDKMMSVKHFTGAGPTNNFRVIVPAEVTLVGAGATNTVIMGAADTTAGADHGCGTNAIACVRLMKGATVKGFTLTGGHTPSFGSYDWGGAVVSGTGSMVAELDAYVVDCIISNNVSARGAVWGATAIRSWFTDNQTSQTATDQIQGSAYNCLFGDSHAENVYITGGKYVNCTFYGNGTLDHHSAIDDNFYNCVMLKRPGGKITLHNCLTIAFGSQYGTCDEDCIIKTVDEMKLDANYAPTKNSPALDNAKAADYYAAFMTAHPEYAYTDLTGGKRIYNAVMDLGAYEFDYRPVFAKRLKPVSVAVTAADTNVTDATSAVRIPAGEGVALKWTLKGASLCNFTVATEGEGAATVTLDGATITPSEGNLYKFNGTAGEHTINITFEGAGAALASAFNGGTGLIWLFK